MLRSFNARKERLNKLSAGNRITNVRSVTLKAIFGMRMPARSTLSSLRRTFRPYCFGLIALAAAIVFWGAASRLSYYHFHPDREQRASVLRLWIEIRYDFGPVTSRHGIRLAPVTSQALSIPAQLRCSVGCADARAVPVSVRRFSLSASLVPLRSPPASQCLRA